VTTTGINYQPAFRFPGQYEDEETGLVYNWNRYYIPEIGRYNRVDPILFPSRFGCDQHSYTYVGSNPIMFADLEGLYYPHIHYNITRKYDKCTGWKLALEIVKVDAPPHKVEEHYPTKEEYVKKLNEGMNECSIEKFALAMHMMQDYHSHVLKAHVYFPETINMHPKDIHKDRYIKGYHKLIFDEWKADPRTNHIDEMMERETKKWVERFCDAYK